MIKAIFLDMDDTLIVNQVLYAHAEALLYGYLRHAGVDTAAAKAAFDAIDKENFKTLGYSRERMPSSFEKTLKHFMPGADAEMVSIVRGFAEEIFTTEAQVKPGVPEAITLLAAKYPVYIVTQGDDVVQKRRLSLLPFKDKITGAYIVDKKSPEVFADIVRRLGYKPGEVVMIGDSLKSDVIPAVEAGLRAGWVEAHNSPLHEVAQNFPQKGAMRFSSLLEAARHYTQTKISPALFLKNPPSKFG